MFLRFRRVHRQVYGITVLEPKHLLKVNTSASGAFGD